MSSWISLGHHWQCVVVRRTGYRWLKALFASLALAWPTSLSYADAKIAQAEFERGVRLAQEKRLDEAVQAFENSIVEQDRLPTRFNLVVICNELNRPLQVVKHALAFMRLGPRDDLVEARDRVTTLMAKALPRLATLKTHLVAHSLELRVNGVAPEAQDEMHVYVTPGVHVLETCRSQDSCETQTVQLSSGQELAWPEPQIPAAAKDAAAPRSLPSTPVGAPPADQLSPPKWRTKTARVLGVVGGAVEFAALATCALASRRAHLLSERDPFSEGFGRTATRYWRASNAVMPLAFAGGVLMSTAVALTERGRGGRTWRLAAVVIGAAGLIGGTFLLAVRPPPIASLNANEPTRQAGSVVFSVSLPLVVYGVGGLAFAGPRGSAEELAIRR